MFSILFFKVILYISDLKYEHSENCFPVGLVRGARITVALIY